MAAVVTIKQWEPRYSRQVTDLILGIQQNEFNIAITQADQPDLNAVDSFYQRGTGNFWIAMDNDVVAGTIALIDIGNSQVALRKMFVHNDYRGKQKAVAQQLLDTVFEWCRQKNVESIYLGTINVFTAAQRFYEKNGFQRLQKEALPAAFPAMVLDDLFYCYKFSH